MSDPTSLCALQWLDLRANAVAFYGRVRLAAAVVPLSLFVQHALVEAAAADRAEAHRAERGGGEVAVGGIRGTSSAGAVPIVGGGIGSTGGVGVGGGTGDAVDSSSEGEGEDEDEEDSRPVRRSSRAASATAAASPHPPVGAEAVTDTAVDTDVQ